MFTRCRTVVLFAIALGAPALAHGTLINFDTYTAGTQITTQYAGLVFSGATIYAPGAGSVAAHSGANEIVDAANSAIDIAFSTAQTQIGGWYTAGSGVTVSTYGAGSSAPVSTMTFGSAAAQTAFSVAGSGITRIEIMPISGLFTLDDLSYTAPPPAGSQASEPASLLLLGTGLTFSAWVPGRRAMRRRAAVA